jgi:hypothetical protein
VAKLLKITQESRFGEVKVTAETGDILSYKIFIRKAAYRIKDLKRWKKEFDNLSKM